MHQLHGSSVIYRIAVGPRQGRKVFTLQTIPASDPQEWIGKVDGFSLHAGVAAKANERKKLERICRYIARPPVSEQHLSITRNGRVRYELKTPWHHPRHLCATGFHIETGSPGSKVSGKSHTIPRSVCAQQQTSSAANAHKRGKGKKLKATEGSQDKSPEERRASMTCTRGHKGATLKARFRY